MQVSLERILPTVQKPGRYTGGEYNQIKKDLNTVRTRIAFCFPDTYEIGMSNLGMRILYGVMNEMDGVWCERVFAPWADMQSAMEANHIPLWALESQDSVADFDMIAFTIGYEMSYSNILNMLRLSGVPLHSKDRQGLKNIVFAGGVCAFNPEPLADYIDFFSLGEGEESTVEIVSVYQKAQAESWDKERFLLEVSKIDGVYVPSFYRHEYNPDGTLERIVPLNGAPATVTKRIVEDLDHTYFPTKPIVASTEIVHDRANLEVFRGCIRGCRFCQAGFSCRPVRRKSPEVLEAQAEATLASTGFGDLTISSLSTSDYRALPELMEGLIPYCTAHRVNLAVPSLRADNFSRELMEKLKTLRRSGLTFAPEAGSQRLRDVINKNLTEEEILSTCALAFSGGWNGVKLYFMLGLPTETDEDVLGIADVAARVMHAWRESAQNKQRGVRITVSTSWFVPKPHTAFQWEPQISKDEYERRVALLRDAIKTKTVTYNWHDSDTSFLEAVLARGDRRLGKVLETAWRKGAHLDAWEEYFSLDRWLEAFDACGLDPHFYANRTRSEDELLPWSMISSGVTQDYLKRERHQAYASLTTPDCRTRCNGCGANKLVGGKCDV